MARSLISVSESTVARLVAMKSADDESLDLVISRALDSLKPTVTTPPPATPEPAPITPAILRRSGRHTVALGDQTFGCWTIQDAFAEAIGPQGKWVDAIEVHQVLATRGLDKVSRHLAGGAIFVRTLWVVSNPQSEKFVQRAISDLAALEVKNISLALFDIQSGAVEIRLRGKNGEDDPEGCRAAFRASVLPAGRP